MLIREWIKRGAARGRPVLGPALTLSSMLLVPSLVAHLALSDVLGEAVGSAGDVMILGVPLILSIFYTRIYSSIAGGVAPHHLGPSLIVFDLSKLALVAYLVAHLRLSITGVFAALAAAQLLQLAYLIRSVRVRTCGWFDIRLIAKWMKGAPFSALPMLLGLLGSIDVLAMSIITASTLVTGYWQSVLIVGLLAYSSVNLAIGLQPRLLAGGGQRDVSKALQLTMMVAIPSLFGVIILSRDLLWVLRPSYAAAWPAAIILAISYFVRIIQDI